MFVNKKRFQPDCSVNVKENQQSLHRHASEVTFIVRESLFVQNVPEITFSLSEDGVSVGGSSNDRCRDVWWSHISRRHDWSGGVGIGEVSVIAALVDARDQRSGISENLCLWISLWFRGSAGHGDDCENNDLKKKDGKALISAAYCGSQLILLSWTFCCFVCLLGMLRRSCNWNWWLLMPNDAYLYDFRTPRVVAELLHSKSRSLPKRRWLACGFDWPWKFGSNARLVCKGRRAGDRTKANEPWI